MTSRQEKRLSRHGLRASLLERVRTSYWFVPALLSAGALGLAFGAVHVDRAGLLAGRFPAWADGITRDAARSLLSGLAGSMITIATVSFSVIIVALSFASNQLGPRLLRNFIRDRANQFVLGGFLATHVYCLALLCLLTILRSDEEAFVPRISMGGAVLLGFVAFGLLIFFVHHVAIRIQADTVIADVRRHLSNAATEFLPDRSCDGEETPASNDPLLERGGGTRCLLRADRTGYVQAIDYEALVQRAQEADVRLGCPVRAGSFVMRSTPLVTIRAEQADPSDRDERDEDDPLDEEALRSAFSIGDQRTDAQDVAYPLDQLVEVALRALSPGINDPFTAIACLDVVGATLADVADRCFLSPEVRDDDGEVRLVRDALRFDDLVRGGIGEIRRAAADHLQVTARLLEVLAEVLAATRLPERRRRLEEEARAAAENAFARDLPPPDRRWIEDRLGRALAGDPGRGAGG